MVVALRFWLMLTTSLLLTRAVMRPVGLPELSRIIMELIYGDVADAVSRTRPERLLSMNGIRAVSRNICLRASPYPSADRRSFL